MQETVMYRVQDLQEILHIGRDKAYSLMKNRSFPAMRLGGRYMVTQEAFFRWLKCYEGKEFKM